MRFVVMDDVFKRLEGVCFGVVVAEGLENRHPHKEIQSLLAESVLAVQARFSDRPVKAHPALLPYREAFHTLGFNPNRFPSSIEALALRVSKGGRIPSINNAVDLANALSLKYLLPMGAHDIDRWGDDMTVRFSRDGDTFIPFGRIEAESLSPGELIYAVGQKVKTRRWIWRQSEVGKVTAESTHIFFPIDGFRTRNGEAVLAARDELAQCIQEYFACAVRTGWVDADHPIMEL